MTWCIGVKAELSVTRCPLSVGACMWQHRATRECKYTEAELTPEEFASRVAAPDHDIDAAKNSIAQEVQLDLQTTRT